MFLTRFEINRARRGARRVLGSPQAMHAAVRYAFPSDNEAGWLPAAEAPRGPADGRVLWRVDDDSRRAFLYIVSSSEPDLTHLVEQAGWPELHRWHTRDYTPLLTRLTTGQRWAFRLAANPTHSVKMGGNARSQRLGHVTADQQQTWFLKRMDQWGFGVEGSDESPSVLVHDRQVKTFRRNGSSVTLSTAVFDGRLRVVDPGTLRAALTTGMGPAKAYGCGLMTLAPLPA